MSKKALLFNIIMILRLKKKSTPIPYYKKNKKIINLYGIHFIERNIKDINLNKN
jgi:hypothetical protein